ncbi:MAG: hypothetical protein V4592_08430 [Bacteroidota bacterium]
MGWFRKKRKAMVLGERSAWVADRIGLAIVRQQRLVADWLGRKTCYWDRASKLLALGLFCAAFGGMSLWLLVRALF